MGIGRRTRWNPPSGSIGGHRIRIYQKTNKGERVTHSMDTHVLVLAGAVGPDFIQNNERARLPNARHTRFLLLAGALETDFPENQ